MKDQVVRGMTLKDAYDHLQDSIDDLSDGESRQPSTVLIGWLRNMQSSETMRVCEEACLDSAGPAVASLRVLVKDVFKTQKQNSTQNSKPKHDHATHRMSSITLAR